MKTIKLLFWTFLLIPLWASAQGIGNQVPFSELNNLQSQSEQAYRDMFDLREGSPLLRADRPVGPGEEYDPLREETPVGDALLFLCLLTIIYFGLKRNKMTHLSNHAPRTAYRCTVHQKLKAIFLLLTCMFFAGNLHAQISALEVLVPTQIVEEGDPATFGITITNQSENSYDDLTLKIVLAANWQYVSNSNSRGYTESISGNTVTITLPSLPALANAPANAINFTIDVLAKCNAVSANALAFTLFNGTNVIDENVVNNPNKYRPILSFNQNHNVNVNYIRGTDFQHTINMVQIEAGAYLKSGGLKVNVTLSHLANPYTEIIAVEYYNTITSTWLPVPFTKNSQTSYTYTFTDAIFQGIGNGDNRFDNNDGTLQLRETYRYEECNTAASYLDATYTPIICGTVQNGPSFAARIFNVPAITDPEIAVQANLKYATGSAVSERGKSVMRITGRGYPLSIPRIEVCNKGAGSPGGVAVNIYNPYISDASGNAIAGSPALTVASFGGGVAKTVETQADTIKFPAGYDWNLVNGSNYYIAFEWDMVIINRVAAKNCSKNFDAATTAPNGVFAYSLLYNYTCPEIGDAISKSSVSPLVGNGSFFQLAWNKGSAAVSNIALSPGANTNLNIYDPWGSQIVWPHFNNLFALSNTESTTMAHRVKVKIPQDLTFTGTVTIVGSATPAVTKVVDAADIDYDDCENIVIFRNSYGTLANNNFTYTLSVQSVPGPCAPVCISDQKAYISHILDYANPGAAMKSYEYACFEYPLLYIIPQTPDPSGCDVYGTGMEINRTTFGYVSESNLTIMNEATAISAGVNRQAAGPYDNVRFTGILERAAGKNWYTPGKTLTTEFIYVASGASHYFSNQGGNAEISYQDGSGTTQTIPIDPADIKYDTEGQIQFITVELLDYINTSDLDDIYEIKLHVNARTTAALPTTPEFLNGLSFLVAQNDNGPVVDGECGPAKGWLCGTPAYDDYFRVWDYKLTDMAQGGGAAHNANALNTGGQFLNLRIPAAANNAVEVFPNEFRPNAAVKALTSQMVNQAMKVYKVYDNQGQTIYDLNGSPKNATIDHPGGNTRMIFTGQYLLTNEQWNTNQPYLVLGDWETVCTGSNMVSQAPTLIDYPTSEQPAERTLEPFNHSFSNTYVNYNTSMAVTPTSQTPLTNEVSWVVTVTNSSTWRATDKKLPYSLFYLRSGGVKNIKIYDYTGGVKKDEVIPEYTALNFGYWEIRIGTITTSEEVTPGNPSTNFMQRYLITAELIDCTLPSFSQYMEFNSNKVEYGNLSARGSNHPNYGNRLTCNYKSLSVTITIPPLNFSGFVEVARNQIGGKYDFCDSIVVENYWSNNTGQNAFNLKMEVALPPYMHLDPNTPVKMYSGTNAWTDINTLADFDGTVDTSNPGKIIFTPKPETALGPWNDAAGARRFTIVYGLRMCCGFRSGSEVKMALSSSNACGDALTQTVTSGPVNIRGFEGDMPVIKFVGKPTMTPNVFDMTSADFITSSNNEINFKGTISYEQYPNEFTDFRAVLPANMELVSGTMTDPIGTVRPFAQDVNISEWFTVAFSDPNETPETGEYEFDLTLRLINPENWDCDTYDVTLENYIYATINCPDLSCPVSEAVSSESFTITVNKLNLELAPASVSFTENAIGGGASEVTVTATVVNNSNVEAKNIKLHVYAGTAQATGDTEIAVPTIPANNQISITHTFTPNVDELCDLRMVLPKANPNNLYICNPDAVGVPLQYGIALNDTICQGSDLILSVEAVTGYTYTWKNSHVTSNGSQATFNFPIGAPVKEDTSLQGANQTQTVTLEVDRGNGCTTDVINKIYVVPAYSVWKGNTDTNWNNVLNWSNGIPDKCTDVLVPDGRTRYPILQTKSPTYPQAACANIEFEHGGEIENPFHLDYDSATVHLTIPNGKWYMVAPPLRDMYSGDYYDNTSDPMTTSRPRVYMQIYQEDNPQNISLGAKAEAGWSNPFNTAEVPLDLGTGAIAWTMNFPTGSFTFPSRHISSGSYQSGTYQVGDYIKQYKYFDKANGTSFLRWGDVLPTRANASRFIYESAATANSVPVNNWYSNRYKGGNYNSVTYNPNFTMPVTNGDPDYPTVLVGNPFMSHLDFTVFRAANTSVIAPNYYIWNGTAFDALNTGTIAPMQSFILTKNVTLPADIDLTFNAAMSVTTPGDKLKSTENSKTLVADVLRNEQRHSGIQLVFDENATPAFNKMKDAYTLFQKDETKPAVLFSIKQNEALSIQTANFKEPVELGIRTTELGSLTLQFSGLENFSKNIYLYDAERGSSQDLHKNDTYVFDNQRGNIRNRFYLMVSDPTGIEVITNGEISIQTDRNHVSVNSTGAIESVRALNIQGQLIYRQNSINEMHHAFTLPQQTSVYIIQVTLASGEVKTAKIIVR